MNIEYMGPYRQNDGWGLAARDYLKALISIPDVNVSCFSTITNNSSIRQQEVEEEIKIAEEKTRLVPDVIIQKAMIEGCTPISMSGTKSLLLTVFENYNIETALNKMYSRFDGILVPCQMNKRAILERNPNTFSVSQPIDTDHIFKNSESKLKLGGLTDTYKFYVIAEDNERKNIHDTILAFLMEFDPIVDKVELFIKSQIPQEKLNSDIKEMQEIIKYKSFTSDHYIRTIPQRLTDDQMVALHNSCDCFITTSRGEAFCRGAAEALCCSNRIIIHDNIGIIDYVDEEDYEQIEIGLEPVFLQKDYQSLSSLDIYSSQETWANPSLLSIKQKMRKAYEESLGVDKDKYLEEFSYRNIGKKICLSFT